MDIIDPMAHSLFSDDLKDLYADYLEIGFDNLIDSQILKELPVVNTLRAFCKTACAIRERHFLKKFIIFVYQLNNGKANPKEIEKRKKAAKEKIKWFYDEVEFLSIILDRFDDNFKSKILAETYLDYINLKISFNKLQEYAGVLDRLITQDFNQLYSIYNKDGAYYSVSLNRLSSLGIIQKEFVLNDQVSDQKPCLCVDGYIYTFTNVGRYLAQVLKRIDYVGDIFMNCQ